MNSFPLSIEYIRAVLAMSAEQQAAHEAWVAEVEAQGYRVVDGGQTSAYEYSSGTGRCDYEVTDYRTGEILASGHGTIEDYEAAGEALSRRLGQPLWHIDPLTDEVDDEGGYLEGPEHALKGTFLGSLLLTWTWNNEDDVRNWIDAGADEVMIHRAVRYATDAIKKREYLKAEGFTEAEVMGPIDIADAPGPLWTVVAHDDSAHFAVHGDQAELERELRERNLFDIATVEGSPLPDGLAGTLAQALADDGDAYCDFVSEYTGLIDPEIA
jgi:hypothetical protein